MTDSTHNIDLKSLLQQNSESNGSPPRASSKFVEAPHCDNTTWCLISADGSTSYIGCKTANLGLESNESPDAIAQEYADSSDEHRQNHPVVSDAEPGVDLSYLEVESETASKLIASLHAMTTDDQSSGSHREIAMPSTKTDLHELLKTDKVCLACPSKPTSMKAAG